MLVTEFVAEDNAHLMGAKKQGAGVASAREKTETSEACCQGSAPFRESYPLSFHCFPTAH